MITRVTLLLLTIVLGAISALFGIPIAVAMHQGYGVGVKELGIAVASGTGAIICLGVWLYLKEGSPRNTI